jgi:hypothetical protein
MFSDWPWPEVALLSGDNATARLGSHAPDGAADRENGGTIAASFSWQLVSGVKIAVVAASSAIFDSTPPDCEGVSSALRKYVPVHTRLRTVPCPLLPTRK